MPSGQAFRARLRIPEQRQLFDYWCDRAGRRPMPSREDLRPADIPRLLPSLGLIDCNADFARAVVRLAGTRLREIYGLDMTGKRFGELAWGERTGYWAGIYRRLLRDCTPLQGSVRGPIAERDHITLQWLRLPLSADGDRVNMILCYDALASAACPEPAE